MSDVFYDSEKFKNNDIYNQQSCFRIAWLHFFSGV